MATFNTINELIEVLDSNPAWLEELRARILTRELLELPARLAQYAENTDRRLAALEEGQAEFRATFERYAENTDRRLAALEEAQTRYAENTDRRLAALEEAQARYAENTDRRLAALEEGQAEFREAINRLVTSNTRLETVVTRLEGVVRRQSNDVGFLRGAFAYHAVTRSLNMAIWNMTSGDLDAVLTERELLGMVRNSGATDLPQNDVTSFVNADIIARVVHPNAEDASYVAIEVSYTVQDKDVRRAVRNAEYLTRFTGLAAQPAVAGVQLDEWVRDDVDSGAVLWHQISELDLRVR